MTWEAGPISPARLIEILGDLGVALPTLIASVTGQHAWVPKVRVFNLPCFGGFNMLPVELTPTSAVTTFRIYACFNTAGVVSVRRTEGGATVAENMNSGNAVAANAAYMWDILVTSLETINFQHSVGSTILYLLVVEV